MKQRKSMKAPVHQNGNIKHIGMMAVCCGLPLLLLFGISVYGLTSQSLEFAILLICPIGMGIMMWMMMRSNSSKKPIPESSDSAVKIDNPADVKKKLM